MRDWIVEHQGLFWTTAVASVAIIAVSVVAVPWLIVRIPADYFAHRARPRRRIDGPPAARTAMLVGKNVLGAVLVLSGVAMLVLPGQGLLTLLVGFFLLDFPGKYRLEQWLVAQPSVHRPINWLRRRHGKARLELR